MVDSSFPFWHAAAAYLYALHLDGSGLAWEYLRRHPDYRRDWRRRRRRSDAAQHWGLRLLEDPDLDARDAHPAWFIDRAAVQLHPDADPSPDARAFRFWNLPGRKQLVHDGRCLRLAARCPDACLRLVLAPDLTDGMACVCAMRPDMAPSAAYRALVELGPLAMRASTPAGLALPRPGAAALLELHTLRALDATLAGASSREVAAGLFGAAAVTRGWHADGGLRSRVRRLVRRGHVLMRGGYRRLARIDPTGQGRLVSRTKRP